ncbi:hypothetical protein [Stenotrophobium rhamnosiphilum]|uniref:Uncharacterized protein n=1 Tax=Stenotrophobium rhamnosiphilum TaxID=2029166 RepID=A0A2T5MB02_9GAMM|nr:hypothetical protein [Stenotrophobium rhamnosiphilum]PTU27720.1 hypothetical protein CJD38_18100 [Stenotrophobium rhamnosiphilum]
MAALSFIVNRKMAEKMRAQRESLWPHVQDDELWMPASRKGFASIPRTMPLIQKIMNDWSKNKPLSATYFALWCRDMGLGFVTIGSEQELALESGFTGTRATYQWKERMKILAQLGFIEGKAGAKGEWTHVLIWNPYKVVTRGRAVRGMQEPTWTALLGRMREIGAEDLNPAVAPVAAAVFPPLPPGASPIPPTP